ncbi:MAG: branched-chain amino acid transport system ATP-binding protein [Parasphingorhabdus sp.]|jgi:branched-chain amino acid transport system ATP-binding protein
MLLSVENLHKSFGGIVATNNVTLNVSKGETHAVIGPNGAGKTTLVSQLIGDLKPDSGKVCLEGEDISKYASHKRAQLGMARSFQITSIISNLTVKENVMLAVQAQCGHSYHFWAPVHKAAEITAPALEMLQRVGLVDAADRSATGLSHGEHRQLEVAMAMATRPKLLLLDEPMAGMGTEESVRMLDIFRTIKGGPGILLIEHDMDVVFALADRISVLVNGAIIASDTPDAIRSNAHVRAAYLGESDHA